MLAPRPIKVLVVDDSALVRTTFTRVLSSADDIEVVGGAPHPYAARELIIEHRPHVIILDVDMPRMNGIAFLRKLMEHYPVPVIMCSDAAALNGRAAVAALEAGAVDVVIKPRRGDRNALAKLGEELTDKVRGAAIAMPLPPEIPSAVTAVPTACAVTGVDPSRWIVVVGASTGGTEALAAFFLHLPADFPPVAVVQHMPAYFTASFAERLDQLSRVQVREGRGGETLTPGTALLARGGVQMTVARQASTWVTRAGSAEPVNFHCPSVDVLFDSVARVAGAAAVGVILTGMGADGARGLLRMRQAGARTFGQNKRSCVIYGMPKSAADLGAVEQTGTPAQLPALIVQTLAATQRKRVAAAP